MGNNLEAIEKLVTENSRLHKELQTLRTGGNVSAYEPYLDAGYAFDLLKKSGFGAGKTNPTLAELTQEAVMMLSEIRKAAIAYEKMVKVYDACEKAIISICNGAEFDQAYKKHGPVVPVAKLRATLETIKIRLERLAKLHPNEEIEQLNSDLAKLLMPEETL